MTAHTPDPWRHDRALSDGERVRAELIITGTSSRAVKIWVDGVEMGQVSVLGGWSPEIAAAFDDGHLTMADFADLPPLELSGERERRLFKLANDRAALAKARGGADGDRLIANPHPGLCDEGCP